MGLMSRDVADVCRICAVITRVTLWAWLTWEPCVHQRGAVPSLRMTGCTQLLQWHMRLVNTHACMNIYVHSNASWWHHFLCAGHLLGLSHDDSKFCEEQFGSTEDKRLMSSILTSIDASKPWSRCTSATITDFFDDGNGEKQSCLNIAAQTGWIWCCFSRKYCNIL